MQTGTPGPDSKIPRCPGSAFCRRAHEGGCQGRSESLCLVTLGIHSTPAGAGRTSAPWVVGFEVQPAESPDPLLPSQIFQVWWLQFEGVTVHSLSILQGVIPCTAGLYATFTGFCGVSQEAPLPERLLYFEMFQPPKEGKCYYNKHPYDFSQYIGKHYYFPIYALDFKIIMNVTDTSVFFSHILFFCFLPTLNSGYYSHEYF